MAGGDLLEGPGICYVMCVCVFFTLGLRKSSVQHDLEQHGLSMYAVCHLEILFQEKSSCFYV